MSVCSTIVWKTEHSAARDATAVVPYLGLFVLGPAPFCYRLSPPRPESSQCDYVHQTPEEVRSLGVQGNLVESSLAQ